MNCWIKITPYFKDESIRFCIRLGLLFLILFVGTGMGNVVAQQYDIVVKGGHMIDPKNHIDQPMDLAIKGERIARVAKNIPSSEGKMVINAKGFYVVPGLINPHVHVFFGSNPNKGFAGGPSSVQPDAFSFRSGITTMVDAGDAGWQNFPEFKKDVIDHAKTRVLEFLNIFGGGMTTNGNGVNTTKDINIDKTLAMIRKYPKIIVGVTVGHYNGTSWKPVNAAEKTAKESKTHVLLECDMPKLPLEGLLERLRAGDIFTHVYSTARSRTTIVDAEGRLKNYVRKAYNKGIIFDSAPGGSMFAFSQVIPSLKQGITPESFGTDLHYYSMNGHMESMLNVMSVFLNLGMSMDKIIYAGTWGIAKALNKRKLGNLSPGAVADVALIKRVPGDFGFADNVGKKIKGHEKLRADLTIRAGRIVWDRDGLTATPYHNPYSEQK